jgi:hypothetical protein
MLSKEEWNATAERAAAAKYGERHAAWLRFKRFGAVPAAAVLALIALGLGAYWTYSHLIQPLFAGDQVGVSLPSGFWVIAGIALVLSVLMLRVRLVGPMTLIRAGALAVIWLSLAGYALSVLMA